MKILDNGHIQSKLLVLGFSAEDSVQILDQVNSLKLTYGVDTIDVEEPKKFHVSWKQEYDCIIFSGLGFKTPGHEIIKKIKNTFPLTEIIFVSFSENYGQAIKALRAGVRDILQFPLDKNLLRPVLLKVLQFRELYQKSQYFGSLTTLFNFFSSSEEDENKLFDKINKYIVGNHHSKPFLVLSFPRELPEDSDLSKVTHRFHWNKEGFDSGYEKKNSDELLSGLNFREVVEGATNYIVFEESGLQRVLINLGHKEKQQLIGFFTIENSEFLQNKTLFDLFVKQVQISFKYLEASRIERKLTSLVHIDDVTGLYNQRRLSKDLEYAIEVSRRRKQQFSLIFIDIDHFKKVNDNNGHRIGSLILVELAKILIKVLRETDLIYRYGGDEFIVLVPNSDVVPDLSLKIGERILKVIKNTVFKPTEELDMKLSVSIGVADFPKHAETLEEIIEIADQMMYHAKAGGRGRVCHADSFKPSNKSSKAKSSKAK